MGAVIILCKVLDSHFCLILQVLTLTHSRLCLALALAESQLFPALGSSSSVGVARPSLARRGSRSEPAHFCFFVHSYHSLSLCMDEIHFAPPKKPWNVDSAVNTNHQWFVMAFKWFRISSSHSMSSKDSCKEMEFLLHSSQSHCEAQRVTSLHCRWRMPKSVPRRLPTANLQGTGFRMASLTGRKNARRPMSWLKNAHRPMSWLKSATLRSRPWTAWGP